MHVCVCLQMHRNVNMNMLKFPRLLWAPPSGRLTQRSGQNLTVVASFSGFSSVSSRLLTPPGSFFTCVMDFYSCVKSVTVALWLEGTEGLLQSGGGRYWTEKLLKCVRGEDVSTPPDGDV